MKRWIIVCVLAAVFLVGANSFAPQLAEVGLSQALSTKFNLQNDDVRVQASPGAKIFLGDIDAVTVHATNFMAGDLKFANFDSNLYGVHFQPLQALVYQELRVTRVDRRGYDGVHSPRRLRGLSGQENRRPERSERYLEGDSVRVQGKVKLGGLVSARADVRGHFGMKGTKLMFIPEAVTVEGLGMQVSSTKLASAEIYDFTDFPLGIQPDRVVLHDGLLTIHGQVSNS